MTLKRRLDELEVRAPEPKQGIPQPPPPDAIELLAEEVIRQLKNGFTKPGVLGVVSELLSSEHVPQELKEELRTYGI